MLVLCSLDDLLGRGFTQTEFGACLLQFLDLLGCEGSTGRHLQRRVCFTCLQRATRYCKWQAIAEVSAFYVTRQGKGLCGVWGGGVISEIVGSERLQRNYENFSRGPAYSLKPEGKDAELFE